MTAVTGTGVEQALDVIRDARGRIERERRLPGEVVAAVAGTGLNRMLLPPALGGTQAPVRDRQATEGRQARRGQITDDPLAMAGLARADTRLRRPASAPPFLA
jgi:hypothetical protein